MTDDANSELQPLAGQQHVVIRGRAGDSVCLTCWSYVSSVAFWRSIVLSRFAAVLSTALLLLGGVWLGNLQTSLKDQDRLIQEQDKAIQVSAVGGFAHLCDCTDQALVQELHQTKIEASTLANQVNKTLTLARALHVEQLQAEYDDLKRLGLRLGADLASAVDLPERVRSLETLATVQSVPLPLSLGWAAVENVEPQTGFAYQSPRCTRSSLGRVFLSGLVRCSTAGTLSATLAVLPSDFRPLGTVVSAALIDNRLGWIDIFPDGRVVLGVTRDNDNGCFDYVSLDGIAFSTV